MNIYQNFQYKVLDNDQEFVWQKRLDQENWRIERHF